MGSSLNKKCFKNKNFRKECPKYKRKRKVAAALAATSASSGNPEIKNQTSSQVKISDCFRNQTSSQVKISDFFFIISNTYKTFSQV
jgi:hypothetical protein